MVAQEGVDGVMVGLHAVGPPVVVVELSVLLNEVVEPRTITSVKLVILPSSLLCSANALDATKAS